MTNSEKMKPSGLIHALTLDGAGGVTEASLTFVEQLDTGTWLDEMSRVRLRDITDRLVRYIEVIDQVTGRASLVQDEIAAQISESMNRRTYIFTLVAAIFLPLGFITGLLGVNVGGVPGVDDPSAFLQLLIACTLIGIGLITAFRWRRWM